MAEGTSKVLKWGLVLVIAVAAVAGGLMMVPALRPASPCDILSPQELVQRHPELQALLDRQRLETERLLARHRAEDVMINMQMSSQRISPEEALRRSMDQVQEVAELRRRQERDFRARCLELESGGLESDR